MNFNFKRFILVLISLFMSGGLLAFAANPSYSVSPGSGTNLKLYCRYNFSVALNSSGIYYNAFDTTLMFNTGEASIAHKSIDSFFSISATGFIRSGNIYRAQGAGAGGTSSNINKNATNFVFRSEAYIGSTTLNFTNCNGGSVSFGTGTTADCSTVNSSINNLDILLGLNDASYNFSPLPCVPDSNVPSIDISAPIGNSQIPSNQVVSMLVNDWIGASSVPGPLPLETNNTSHYRYGGLAINPSNYVAAPSTVDNQEGVNSSTIIVTVTAPSYPAYGTYVLSGASLTVNDFAGDGTSNKFTWDSEIRGYNVSFNPPSPYPVEKQINLSISASDRPNENGQTHTGSKSFSFNSPIAPSAIMLIPSVITFVSPTLNEIKFYISDDWAGVDTGSVKFTIPEISSGSIFMTGYTYSGSDLTFVLSGGATGLGNGGDYIVTFSPKWSFPANHTITITGTFADLAGTIGNKNVSFSTRPDCSYFGCSNILTIHIPGLSGFLFSGNLLMIYGTGHGYSQSIPYLSGNTLTCSMDYAGAILTGNVNIYSGSSSGVSINGMLYNKNNIYITGLDFIYQNGVVVIPD